MFMIQAQYVWVYACDVSMYIEAVLLVYSEPPYFKRECVCSSCTCNLKNVTPTNNFLLDK